MHRQRMMKTQHQHVWILFSTLAFCMIVLGSIPGSQSADAHSIWQHPKPAIPGVVPPPDSAGHPLFAPPHPGFPPRRHAGFPPPNARFVEYHHIRASYIPKTQPAHVTVPLAKVINISSTVNLPEHDKHLWLESAQISSLRSPHKMLKPPFSKVPNPRRFVPPPDGYWFRVEVFTGGQAGERPQEKRLIQDSAEAFSIKAGTQQKYNEGQSSLAQQFQFPKDPLQHLQVLRL